MEMWAWSSLNTQTYNSNVKGYLTAVSVESFHFSYHLMTTIISNPADKSNKSVRGIKESMDRSHMEEDVHGYWIIFY